MTDSHPELAAEQAHLDRAMARLEAQRAEAVELRRMVEVGKGGTTQARWEREVINEQIMSRLIELDIGDRSLAFGRIDQTTEAGGGSYHIGRVAVADEDLEPLVVDWRAPVSEAFFRATSSEPLGLVRRRHFVSQGRRLVDMEDEFFGDARGQSSVVVDGRELRGYGALISALEQGRTGRLGDIVGTIQAEQDEIIRAPLPGVLVVQGGPGTGKTVVALHRAAFQLYTHRFPLEGQGVLVVGPNRLFLGYIEQVLPSLGESGAELAVLADLVDGVRVQGRDDMDAARVKGDLRMAKVIRRAVRDRQRPLRRDLLVGIGSRSLRLRASETERIINQARRRFRTHNGARRFVVRTFFEALADDHPEGMDPNGLRDLVGDNVEVREALNWMWPVLTPAELLHDLYGSDALLRSAAGRELDRQERVALRKPWQPDKSAARVVWTVDDVPVLDEAAERLGPRPGRGDVEESRTYGHIVVDEAQDLSPMQLRMLTRRSLNGSMTVVGDIAQSTGAWAHQSWDEVLEHLPDRRPATTRELTVGYRITGPTMDLAAKLLPLAAPGLSAPIAVRQDGSRPRFEAVRPGPDRLKDLAESVASAGLGSGNLAVITTQADYEPVVEALTAAGLSPGRAIRDGLNHPVTVVPVTVVKGLEVDVAVVFEPQGILDEQPQGARSLYVAMTRATKQLVVVHSEPMPEILADSAEPSAA